MVYFPQGYFFFRKVHQPRRAKHAEIGTIRKIELVVHNLLYEEVRSNTQIYQGLRMTQFHFCHRNWIKSPNDFEVLFSLMKQFGTLVVWNFDVSGGGASELQTKYLFFCHLVSRLALCSFKFQFFSVLLLNLGAPMQNIFWVKYVIVKFGADRSAAN